MRNQHTGVVRPASLRRPTTAMALGLTAALMANPAAAQDAESAEAEEVELGTLRIEDRTADVNPYTQEGAPYKARVSGDPRRVKPLSETPATITVLTETQIEESGASDLRDILDGTPGVTVGTGENGNAFGDRYIIRGEEVRSDVFVDGLRDPGMTTRESFAVEQIEITKGPSGTFGGRGTSGGAVNSITKQASTDYNFNKVELGAGTDEYWRAALDSNFRLSDSAAIRANLLYSSQDVPDREPADRERWGAAVSALLTPSESVRVLLDYYHLAAEDSPDLGGYLPPPTGTEGNVTRYAPWHDVPAYLQDEDFMESEVDTFTGRIFFEPSENLQVINSTRYGTTENGYVVTGLRGGAYDPATGNYAALTLSTHQGWQEVEYFVNQLNAIGKFATGSMQHTLIVGAEYSDQQVRNGVFQVTNTGTPNCGTSYCLTTAGPDRTVVAGDIGSLLGRQITRGGEDSNWQVETWSFYLMDTVDVTPWLTLHGGVRLDNFDYSNTITALSRPVGDPLRTTEYSYGDTLWNGHAGVVVKPHEEGMVYFSWGTARNINGGESDLGSSCGYGGICVPGDGTSTAGDGRPETSTNFELGTKWDLFDDRFMVTAALFRTTKDDVFESVGTGYEPGGSLNTGKHRIKGVELGLVGNITPQLSGQIGATFMDSEILRTSAAAPAGETYVGKNLSNFANNHFTGQLRYQATEAFAFGGTATYKGAMYTGQPDSAPSYNFTLNTYTYKVPSYWTFDAFASYKLSSNIAARVNVTNLSNENYYVAGYRSGHFLYKGDERRATLTLTGRF
ncbi:TonB-dependent receptor [Altererythrobacter soli]|uniref:TonB-dependent receptor n=1 Tax=Croceibacterium soli TaxID=1739690 RepID=A0A6I4US72_9SPHN|nr:TonB-dependent receptor [Croceibacterium soli]MXP41631.1 TonB-dependent receptor [Croceibacterium soli]